MCHVEDVHLAPDDVLDTSVVPASWRGARPAADELGTGVRLARQECGVGLRGRGARHGAIHARDWHGRRVPVIFAISEHLRGNLD